MSKINFNGETVKKVLSIASIAVAGIVAVTGAIADQKKQQEFDELKKAVADLQNKQEGLTSLSYFYSIKNERRTKK